MSILLIKSFQLKEEIGVPGGRDLRQLGAVQGRTHRPDEAASEYDMWFDSELRCIGVQLKGGRRAVTYTPLENVKAFQGLEPIEETAPTVPDNPVAVEPPKVTATIVKGPTGKAMVGKVTVGDPDED